MPMRSSVRSKSRAIAGKKQTASARIPQHDVAPGQSFRVNFNRQQVLRLQAASPVPALANRPERNAPAEEPQPAPDQLLSVKEAAYRLRKSPDSVYSWLRRGRLQGRQPGGRRCSIQVLESSVLHALQFSLGKA